MWHFLCSSKYTYPGNGFQKFNEIQRRRLSHWNRHIDSLIFVARPHHCHQSLAMINNACYQLFTAKLNYLMDTFRSSSAGQSTEATRSAAKWLLELGAHLPGETVGVCSRLCRRWHRTVCRTHRRCGSSWSPAPGMVWGSLVTPAGAAAATYPNHKKPIYLFNAWTMLL